MRKHLKNPLVKGSILLLITFNLFNLINFLFQFSMARMLSIADYGTLAALLSITYILSVFSESIQLVITKFASSENNKGKLKNVTKRALKKFLKISLILFVAYLLISIPLSKLFNIDFGYFSIIGTLIFTSFMCPVTRGLLQGQKKFTHFGLNFMVEAIVKLALSIFLVMIGWGIYGALTGIVLGAASSFFISLFPLKDIFRSKEKKASVSQIKLDSKPFFIITLCILLFYSIDILIAKAVFDAETAGYYAIASILSKAVFWGTQPISRAMFPLSVKKSKITTTVFKNATRLLFALILIILIGTFAFSDLIVTIFSGKQIPQSAAILPYLILSTALLAFTNLDLLYKLAQGRVKNPYIFFIFIIIEGILLFTFTSSLVAYSIAYIVSSLIFLIWVYFFIK